ncbi:hypothetical protein GOAMR_48_00380 [Gordonia amarae NBRC 15530]|uniref:Uncharacterized protein n=1 Tax=Gordonia amarae NBRC 15530 TaxID=1075090 RepID=G7GRA3_9ACTN|nr:hypothetical protein GOAMR_48_00380 [Gordonia amarae NBRC 15530]
MRETLWRSRIAVRTAPATPAGGGVEAAVVLPDSASVAAGAISGAPPDVVAVSSAVTVSGSSGVTTDGAEAFSLG